MVRFKHLVEVLRARFYTISVKRALLNIFLTFATTSLTAIIAGKSVREAAVLGIGATGLIVLGYLQDARKGCSFKDQTDRLQMVNKKDENEINE